MNIKSRIERLEQRQGSASDGYRMVDGFDRFGPCNTIEEWQAACKKIDVEYAKKKVDS